MIVYRVAKSKHSGDLTGTGPRLNGGRWNRISVPCIYTSESRALAVLEYSVNVSVDDIPRALSITTLEIPGNNVLELAIANLPGNWSAPSAPPETQDFGSNLLTTAAFPVIKIPSAVIPEEFNYILNPLHPESAQFHILGVHDFVFDLRIKMK